MTINTKKGPAEMPIAGEPDWFQKQILEKLEDLQFNLGKMKEDIATLKSDHLAVGELEKKVEGLEKKSNMAAGAVAVLGGIGAIIWIAIKALWGGGRIG